MFDTVEVNATFYRLQKAEAVGRWFEQTPSGFEFVVKASRYLTHVRRLQDLAEGVARLYEPLEPLGAKLGPTLWQLPPNFKRDEERLAHALDTAPPGRHAFEPRHETWFHPDVYALLRERNVALVTAHRKGLDVPLDVVTADFAYLRFHYGERGRRGNYSASELEDWAARVAALEDAALDVYAYFNNDWEAFAPRNAVALRRNVGAGRTRAGR